MQSTLKGAKVKARTIDEQKGISKVAHEVGNRILIFLDL
jgi:hypothetical protein